MEIIDRVKQALEYTKNKKYKKAEEIYLELLKDSPENNTILSFLGILYYTTRKYKKAEKYLLKSYEIKNSDDIIPYLGKVEFLLEKDKETIDYLGKIIDTTKDIKLFYIILQACENIEDFKQECIYAEKAHKLFPFEKDFLYYLTMSNIKNGNFENGEKYANKLYLQ